MVVVHVPALGGTCMKFKHERQQSRLLQTMFQKF